MGGTQGSVRRHDRGDTQLTHTISVYMTTPETQDREVLTVSLGPGE